MITSEGSGMQADSMAIRATIPMYPAEEITPMMNALRTEMVRAIMKYQWKMSS